ncbi:MAG: BURP domain-containing protein [Actinomycetota bacterium]|nr:BURP domain-containing protein [Actinomycetota bacterium]
MSTAKPSRASYWLTMIGPHGRAIHALNPATNRAFCTTDSSKWSQQAEALKPLNRTGQPTCHHCRRVLGL